MLEYREITPGGEARGFIDCCWTMECDASEASVQRVVPDGRAELIFNLAEPFESFQDGQWRIQPACFVAGQITGPLLLRPSGPAKILGARFLPQGAGQVFGVPMHELTGRMVPIADLSRALAGGLENARESASFVRIESALARVCGEQDLLVAEAVRQIVWARGACDLAQLARRLGIGSRRLERRFQRGVGMPPKLFCRIQRFQHVFQVIEDGCPNWVNAAVECGYYDQAHLIRDFRDFSGKAPSVLLADADLAKHFVRDPAVSDFYKTAASASGWTECHEIEAAILRAGGCEPAVLSDRTQCRHHHQPGRRQMDSRNRRVGKRDAARGPANRGHGAAGALSGRPRVRAPLAQRQRTHRPAGGPIVPEAGRHRTVSRSGGFAFLPAREVQRLSCVSKTRCTFYAYWDGKLDFHAASAAK